METLKLILLILQLISSVALIVIVIFQSGKESGLSGALSGNSDTYLSKGKSATFDAKLARLTKWVAAAFALLTLFVALLQSM